MKTTDSNKPSARPVTLAFPEPLFRRMRLWCASRDLTMSAFVTDVVAAAVADLPAELADIISESVTGEVTEVAS